MPSQLFCRIPRSLAGSIAVLSLMTGCTSARSTPVELSLRVEPAGQPGVYLVTGTTNLPDGSQITIEGVRDLHPAGSAVQQNSSKSTYVILARQRAEVGQGKWQTSLNLWQVGPDGRYQEAWQLNQPDLSVSLKPGDKVAFLALFKPDDQIQSVRQQLEQNHLEIKSPLLRFAADGQRYLQANQTLEIGLPVGKTAPAVRTAADMNGGWGDRSSLPPNSPMTEKPNLPAPQGSQTTAPLSSSEFLR